MNNRPTRLLVSAIAAAASLTLSLHPATADVVSIWNGTTNNWATAADWTPASNFPNNGTPAGTLYDVTINSGNITLNVNPTIQTLAWAGGTLTGGTLNVLGGITLAALTTDTLSGTTLNNSAGQTTTFGTGGNVTLLLQNNAQFKNAGTFLATNGNITTAGTASLFTNSGNFTLNLPSSSSNFSVATPFTNTANVSVQAGNLFLNAGDNGTTTGIYNIAAAGTLNLAGNFTLASTTSFTGAGSVNFSSGAVSLAGANTLTGATNFSGAVVTFTTNNLSFAGPVNFSSGALIGTSGSLTVHGLFTWAGGTFGSGTLNALDGIALAGLGNVTLSGTIVNNPAGQTATFGTGGNFSLILENNAQFKNAGTFIATNGSIAYGGGTNTPFNNSGNFTLNLPLPSNNFSVTAPFANGGTVNVQDGNLMLIGGDGGTTTGSFNIAAAGSLNFAGSPITLASTTSISGAGTVNFSNGTVFLAGANTVTGATNFNGSTVNFTTNNVAIAGAVNFSGGTLTGTSGSLNVHGLFTWSGGSINGGNVTLSAGLILAGNSQTDVSAATLTIPAGQSATLGTGGNFILSLVSTALFNNAGNFTATNGNISGFSSSALFANTGNFTVNLAAPSASFSVQAPFANSGNINLLQGILNLNMGDGGNTTGAFNISASAALTIASNFNFGPTSTLNGAGTVNFNSGNISFAGADNLTGATNFNQAPVTFPAGNLTIAGPVSFINGQLTGTTGTVNVHGLFTWSGGEISGGNVILSAGLNLLGDGFPTLSAATLTLPAGQTATLGPGGNATLYLQNGALFTNAGNFTATNGSISGSSSIFANSGTFTLNLPAPSNSFSIPLPFTNSGTVNVLGGILNLTSGDNGITTGSYNVSALALLNLAGNFTFTGSATISGAGAAALTGVDTSAFGFNIANLAITNSLQIKSNGTPTGVSKVSVLTLSGVSSNWTSKLDLTNNSIIIETAAGTLSSILATVQNQVRFGTSSHTAGILSSTLAAHTALAVIDNAVAGLTTFRTKPVDSAAVIVSPEILGDVNLDGVVNIADLNTLAAHWQQSALGWTQGDFNIDNLVNIADLNILAANWQFTGGAGSSDFLNISLPSLATPEPTTLLLLSLSTLALLHKKRS